MNASIEIFYALPPAAKFHVLHKLLRIPAVSASLMDVMQNLENPEQNIIEAELKEVV